MRIQKQSATFKISSSLGVYEARRVKKPHNSRVDLPQPSVPSSCQNASFLPSSSPLRFPKEPPLTRLPASLHPQQSVGVHTRRQSFVASMLPHRTCARSVRSHLLANKSKLLVTDWNTAFCCFPCCTDNGVTHSHTYARTHTQYVAVLHPCLLSESRCGSMTHHQKTSHRRREYNWSFGVGSRLCMCLSLLPSHIAPSPWSQRLFREIQSFGFVACCVLPGFFCIFIGTLCKKCKNKEIPKQHSMHIQETMSTDCRTQKPKCRKIQIIVCTPEISP